jgi:hypothetical protein
MSEGCETPSVTGAEPLKTAQNRSRETPAAGQKQMPGGFGLLADAALNAAVTKRECDGCGARCLLASCFFLAQ